jgi:hypothetical protein
VLSQLAPRAGADVEHDRRQAPIDQDVVSYRCPTIRRRISPIHLISNFRLTSPVVNRLGLGVQSPL